MAKRFTDTEIWDKQWFMELSPKHKCFVKYVRDKCDLAGIWYPNYMLASVYIGEQVFEDDLLAIDSGNQFERLSDGKIYCIGFIDFQYGSSLNPYSPVHKKIIDILDKNSIEYQLKQEHQPKQVFNPPTLNEVLEEMITKTDEYNAQIQSVRFHSYYESNGWMVGRNKMKNWRSAAAGWINRSKPERKQITSDDIKKNIKSIANRKLSEL
jgi:hypothetical protein